MKGCFIVQEVFDFLKKCGTYYLATIDGDQPRVRPFGTVNIFEGKLYIQTGKTKACFKEMAVNPKVGICAFDGQQWLRIAATAVDDDRIEAKTAMLDNYPHLKARYDVNDPNTAVLYLKDATATFSSFTAPDRVVKF